MFKAIAKAVKAQINWWRNQIAFGEQRRFHAARATSLAVKLSCTGALRRNP
jgi:hypothetical protein